MNRFNQFLKWSWTFLVAVTLTLGLAGCDGDDGAAGATGAAGTPGADGQACWDLNGNGVGDVATEDINGDGVFGDVTEVAPTLDWTQLQSFGIGEAAPGVGQFLTRLLGRGLRRLYREPGKRGLKPE